MLLRQERTALHRERDLLYAQLQAARDREQAAREREALLLQMLQVAQQQVQWLLAMPRMRVQDSRTSPDALDHAPPAFDPTRYVLGKLCPRKHEYQNTGKSLLQLPQYKCRTCDAEKARERRQAQRSG